MDCEYYKLIKPTHLLGKNGVGRKLDGFILVFPP